MRVEATQTLFRAGERGIGSLAQLTQVELFLVIRLFMGSRHRVHEGLGALREVTFGLTPARLSHGVRPFPSTTE